MIKPAHQQKWWWFLPFVASGEMGCVMLIQLHHVVIVEFGPLEDVLLAHNVWVDEQVAVTHTEVLLTRRTFEALQMVNLVPHTHRHLKRSNPLLAGSTETVLTKKPEMMGKKSILHWVEDGKHPQSREWALMHTANPANTPNRLIFSGNYVAQVSAY